MYSYTATNAHYITPPSDTQPALRIKCKCLRTLIQEEIYTCLSCATYSCHYCTNPEFTSLQCRSCRYSCETTVKNVRCKTCFACPYCESVLIVAKDPKTRLYIMLCQFCYWSTKDVNIKEERVEGLVEALAKASASIKDTELRLYNHAVHFIKDSNSKVERENQNFKYAYTSHRKLPASLSSLRNLSFMDESASLLNPITSLHTHDLQEEIGRVGLEEKSEEFKNEIKYPHGLPLQAKRTRRCPECKKPLTTFYRNRGNQYKIELMHKDLKILQCQRNPAYEKDGSKRVKIKFVREAYLQGEKCEIDQIKQVEMEKEFKISIKILNRTRGTSLDVDYIFITEKRGKKE